MTPTLTINSPSVTSFKTKNWTRSTLRRLPYPTKVNFRTIQQSRAYPITVSVDNPGTTKLSSNGNTSTTFPLLPLWDLDRRVNAEEIFLAVMSRAVRHAYGKPIDPGDGNYRIINSRPEAEKWVRNRIGKTVIAIDIESDKNPQKDHPSTHSILCLGMCDGKETVILPEDLFNDTWEEFADLLDQATCVAHNGKFDSVVLGYRLRGRNDPIKIKHDTMLAHYALWPAGGDDEEDSKVTSLAYHGLKLLGDLYLGCGDWSLEDSEYENMRSVPLERLYRYNAWDVQRTLLLLKIFRDQFKQAPVFEIAGRKVSSIDVYSKVLVPGSELLSWVEPSGITVDVPYVESELIPDAVAGVQNLTRDLIKIVNDIMPNHVWTSPVNSKKLLPEETNKFRFNPSSPDQVRSVFAAQGVHLPIDRKSKSKKGSTSKRTLTVLLRTTRKKDPFITRLLELRASEKLLGTYIRPFLDDSHTNHPYPGMRRFPTFDLHKTLSGRLASRGPNIQNQPNHEGIKKAYVPSAPGRLVVSCDYGQAELRVMAVLSKDPYLCNFFHAQAKEKLTLPKDVKGRDLFNTMMPSVFRDIDFEKYPEKKEQLRRPLKAFVYGVGYDRGAKDIAEDLNMPVKQAQDIQAAFLRTVPKLSFWQNEVVRKILAGERLVTRFGRYMLHETINEDNRADILRRGLSFLPQSSASDCCLLAAVELGRFIRSEKLDWTITALIHDAIYMDVPEQEAQFAIDKTNELMVASAAEWFPEVPFATDGKFGASWAAV
ncbi:DNA polymerase [Rhodococcus qingshengii]|uniref:DNA polymerase n=1 Tax=Rhodococcus qingshengii TaxID=334542 RepID=UPI0035DD8050